MNFFLANYFFLGYNNFREKEKMENFQEKRKHKRVNWKASARFKPYKAIIPIRFPCEIVDIGVGGVRITTSKRTIPRNEVEVTFGLPDYLEKFIMPSDVVWTHTSDKDRNRIEAGLRFSSLSDNNSYLLREYIAKN